MWKKQVEVNYLYFGAFFVLLLLTSGDNIFMRGPFIGPKTFFFLYAAGQALFEVFALIFLQWCFKNYLGNFAAKIFISATFILFVLHFFDFLSDRLFDLSVWETLDAYVLSETWHNFMYLLDATGVPMSVWIVIFAIAAALPFLGIAFYFWTNRAIQKSPFSLSSEWFLQAFVCIPVALFFWEFSAARSLHPDSYTLFIKSLPWKRTFLSPKVIRYMIPTTLAMPQTEEEMWKSIKNDRTVLAQKPNIYLFVIESLREDFINAETAPSLSRFRQEAAHFELALSNANGSHPSWFSIFHSQFAYAWHHLQDKGWKMGSPPLQLLKKWGYKVRLYTSAELHHYDMENLLFGKERRILDAYHPFHHSTIATAAKTDAQTIDQWEQDVADNPELKEGQVVIFFLDSTHFTYSWPEHWELKFAPISTNLDFFTFYHSDLKIEKIKNRYRNAIFYVDSLFGRFFKGLPDPENAIVVVTGDHGEEFFEHGHLFHGSHLTHEQTHIPIYMKFGKRQEKNLPSLVSQIDIFPSILHHLSNKQIPFLEGKSIFSHPQKTYAILCRVNAGRTPYEFCFHDGARKLIVQFEDKSDIFGSNNLKIRSIWDKRDQCIFNSHLNVDNWVQTNFNLAFERLFSERVPTE